MAPAVPGRQATGLGPAVPEIHFSSLFSSQAFSPTSSSNSPQSGQERTPEEVPKCNRALFVNYSYNDSISGKSKASRFAQTMKEEMRNFLVILIFPSIVCSSKFPTFKITDMVYYISDLVILHV